jgi:hypothetical protein
MRILFSIIAIAFLLSTPKISFDLNVGDKAPLFEAESTMGTISLKSYVGNSNVILAFYYADFTPV